MDCSWDHPGTDPYTGTATTAILAFVEIPILDRAEMALRASANDFDDIAVVDRDSIRGKRYDYEPAIARMHFGSKGRMCETVSRNWAPGHVEMGMVVCSGSWCAVRWSVCNNWSIIYRREPTTGQVPPLASPIFTSLSSAAIAGLSQQPVGALAPLGQGIAPVTPFAVPVGGFATPQRVVYAPGVVISPVPEPVTFHLTALGLGGLIGSWVMRAEYQRANFGRLFTYKHLMGAVHWVQKLFNGGN